MLGVTSILTCDDGVGLCRLAVDCIANYTIEVYRGMDLNSLGSRYSSEASRPKSHV
jgi:hypothetical protein